VKNTSYFYVVLFLYGSYFRMTLWKVFLPFCTNSLPSVKRSAVTLKSISFMGCSASFTPPCCTARLPSEREGTTLIVVSSVRISMPSANSAAEISVEGASTVAAPLPNNALAASCALVASASPCTIFVSSKARTSFA